MMRLVNLRSACIRRGAVRRTFVATIMAAQRKELGFSRAMVADRISSPTTIFASGAAMNGAFRRTMPRLMFTDRVTQDDIYFPTIIDLDIPAAAGVFRASCLNSLVIELHQHRQQKTTEQTAQVIEQRLMLNILTNTNDCALATTEILKMTVLEGIPRDTLTEALTSVQRCAQHEEDLHSGVQNAALTLSPECVLELPLWIEELGSLRKNVYQNVFMTIIKPSCAFPFSTASSAENNVVLDFRSLSNTDEGGVASLPPLTVREKNAAKGVEKAIDSFIRAVDLSIRVLAEAQKKSSNKVE